ncbi:hypothetical protein WN51_11856 [Melipona quadrifasciata]|uniref:Uncharacterized protein n=1 Tax=Melipona quadrifasciata TaxID=166423 RepID=A0A0M9A2U9_9HYME|nr:hypothetical protein WN51_11856 [Melipona quadrifasciata]
MNLKYLLEEYRTLSYLTHITESCVFHLKNDYTHENTMIRLTPYENVPRPDTRLNLVSFCRKVLTKKERIKQR